MTFTLTSREHVWLCYRIKPAVMDTMEKGKKKLRKKKQNWIFKHIWIIFYDLAYEKLEKAP